jgi:DNA gyrase/topoisomerase IV subunit B
MIQPMLEIVDNATDEALGRHASQIDPGARRPSVSVEDNGRTIR